MQLTMASEPDIPVFNIRARHRSAVNEADTFARAIPIPLERRGTQYCRGVNCVAFMGTKRLQTTSETQPEEVTRSADGRQESARGCLLLLTKADDGSSIHSTTSHHSAKTSHRTADTPSDITNGSTQWSRREMELIC
ncbi:hypothetical protein TcBrA4_0043120 [Trypanosoma cruzi]|nr:hypothetical protein TcBrA4_0043120 [Trypanosoma cruzi]